MRRAGRFASPERQLTALRVAMHARSIDRSALRRVLRQFATRVASCTARPLSLSATSICESFRILAPFWP